MMRFVCALAALVACGPARADDEVLRGMLFSRYTTTDEAQRAITFYVHTPPRAKHALPIVLFVQGAGCESLFQVQNRAIVSPSADRVVQVARDRARVIVVEKPDVAFLDEPPPDGGCKNAIGSPAWMHDVRLALTAALELPLSDPARVLVIGWGEGALVAARLADELPSVTDVAALAPSALAIAAWTCSGIAPAPAPVDAAAKPPKRNVRVYTPPQPTIDLVNELPRVFDWFLR